MFLISNKLDLNQETRFAILSHIALRFLDCFLTSGASGEIRTLNREYLSREFRHCASNEEVVDNDVSYLCSSPPDPEEPVEFRHRKVRGRGRRNVQPEDSATSH